MSLQPLLDASWAVKAHVALVLPALFIGTWLVFFSRKGARPHRWAGAAFLVLIAIGAVVALFIPGRIPIPGIGLGPIHLIVPFAIYAVWRAFDGARRGNIKQHRTWINVLYFGLLILVFLMNALVFPGITQDIIFGDMAIGHGEPIVQTVFAMGSRTALTGWMALAAAMFAVRVRPMLMLYSGMIVPGLLAVSYLALVALVFIEGPGDGAGFHSLAAVKVALSSDAGMAAGWQHFLAFDLFVATWIARDGLSRGISRFILVPVLAVTFMFGPIGLLAYLLPSAVSQKRAAA